MTPEALMVRLMEAISAGDVKDASFAIQELDDWLKGGGYVPTIERGQLRLFLTFVGGRRRSAPTKLRSAARKASDMAQTIGFPGFRDEIYVTRSCGPENGLTRDRLRIHVQYDTSSIYMDREVAIRLRDALTKVLDASPTEGEWRDLGKGSL